MPCISSVHQAHEVGSMPVTLELDEPKRRVLALIEPDHDGIPLTDRLAEVVEQRPNLGGWDWIVEVRGKLPKAVPWNLERLVSVFDCPASPADTVVVSTDPIADAWARVLSSNFRVRRHWVMSSRAAARELLDNRPVDRLMPLHELAREAWR